MALELVVIVVMMVMVMVMVMIPVIMMVMALVVAFASFHVFLRGAEAPKENIAGKATVLGRNDLDRGTNPGGDGLADARERFRVNQVRLVEHHQVGTDKLVLEEFLHRTFVIEGLVGGALRGKGGLVRDHAAIRDRGRINDGHDGIDGDACLDAGP
jgi:hypothetical protein